MRRVAHGQLSFDAAPKAGKRAVDMAAIKLSGMFPPEAVIDNEGRWPQLEAGERVKVVVVAEDSGDVIAEAPGLVEVSFPLAKEGRTTRAHTVKVGATSYTEDGVWQAARKLKDVLAEHGVTMTMTTAHGSATVGPRSKT